MYTPTRRQLMKTTRHWWAKNGTRKADVAECRANIFRHVSDMSSDTSMSRQNCWCRHPTNPNKPSCGARHADNIMRQHGWWCWGWRINEWDGTPAQECQMQYWFQGTMRTYKKDQNKKRSTATNETDQKTSCRRFLARIRNSVKKNSWLQGIALANVHMMVRGVMLMCWWCVKLRLRELWWSLRYQIVREESVRIEAVVMTVNVILSVSS